MLLAEDWTNAAKRRSSTTPVVPGDLSVAGEYDQLSGRTGTLMYM